jgi:hypothetical protein
MTASFISGGNRLFVIQFHFSMAYLFSSFNSIGDKMLSRLVSSAVDREIDSETSQTQGATKFQLFHDGQFY